MKPKSTDIEHGITSVSSGAASRPAETRVREKTMFEDQAGEPKEPPRRAMPRIVLAVIIPILLQIAMFFWIADWSSGRGSGTGFLGIGALLLLLISVPVTLVANVWMLRETKTWRLLWVCIVGNAQAIIIPCFIVISLLLTIK